METLADFATVHFFAINTLTTAIYDTWLGWQPGDRAAKLSCLMLLAVVLLIALERRSRQRQQVFQKSMGFEQPATPSGGLRGVLAGLWCWGLVLAGSPCRSSSCSITGCVMRCRGRPNCAFAGNSLGSSRP